MSLSCFGCNLHADGEELGDTTQNKGHTRDQVHNATGEKSAREALVISSRQLFLRQDSCRTHKMSEKSMAAV